MATQCAASNRSGTRCRDEAFADGLGRADRRFIRHGQKLRKQLGRQPEARMLAGVFFDAVSRR
jgi:hypothetical protein